MSIAVEVRDHACKDDPGRLLAERFGLKFAVGAAFEHEVSCGQNDF